MHSSPTFDNDVSNNDAFEGTIRSESGLPSAWFDERARPLDPKIR